eukprot:SAG11_NODE_1176_length_5600_cov_8.953827_7_plen_485_part_00
MEVTTPADQAEEEAWASLSAHMMSRTTATRQARIDAALAEQRAVDEARRAEQERFWNSPQRSGRSPQRPGRSPQRPTDEWQMTSTRQKGQDEQNAEESTDAHLSRLKAQLADERAKNKVLLEQAAVLDAELAAERQKRARDLLHRAEPPDMRATALGRTDQQLAHPLEQEPDVTTSVADETDVEALRAELLATTRELASERQKNAQQPTPSAVAMEMATLREELCQTERELIDEKKRNAKLIQESEAAAQSAIARAGSLAVDKQQQSTNVIETLQQRLEKLNVDLLAARAQISGSESAEIAQLRASLKQAKAEVEAMANDLRVTKRENVAENVETLMALARNDSAAAVKHLVQKVGVDVRWADAQSGRTFLMSAAEYAGPDTVCALLDCGAEVNAADVAGQTALMCAAAAPAKGANVEALLGATSPAELMGARDANLQTALMHAAASGATINVALLLQQSPPPELELRDLSGKRGSTNASCLAS